jgi:hypothetical protein
MISAKNEIEDGPEELCCKLDAPSLETNMEICPASALAISATIFGFETSNDCIIFSNMQTDPFTCDISSFYKIESTASIGGCVTTTTTVTAPMLVALMDQFSYGFAETLLRICYDYHFKILQLSRELSCSKVYRTIIALCEITISAILHVVYVGQFSDHHNGIDSFAFDDADSDKSYIYTRRSRFDFTRAANDINSTAPIRKCDAVTTTTTTAATTALTTTTARRHQLLLADFMSGG